MAVPYFVQATNCYIMLYPELVVKQGKTFTSLSGEAFSVSASHNYCGIEGRFKAVKISYCPDVSKYGRKVAWAGRTHLSLKGKIVGKPSTWNDIIVDSTIQMLHVLVVEGLKGPKRME